jgi:tetratricopeptide (TPR) repeat protein
MFKSILVVVVLSFGLSLTYAQNQDSSAYFYDKGLADKNARKFREAEKNFVKASQYAPDNFEIVVELANAYIAQNRYAEAREKYLRADQIKSNDAGVTGNLATLSFNLRKWDDAIKYSQKAQKLLRAGKLWRSCQASSNCQQRRTYQGRDCLHHRPLLS